MRSLVAAGALALAILGAPATAWGGCGGVQVAAPHHHRSTGLPPLAVGDSTMLLALPNLAARGFAVNAHGCRQFPEARALLARLARAHRLPHLVLIALGADGNVEPGDVSATLRILGPGRVLVLLTPRELGGGSGGDADTVRRAARAHPGRVHLLDWVAVSAGHGAWFQPDGVHLTFAGARAFARLLAQALPLTRTPPPSITLGAGAGTRVQVRLDPTSRWRVISRARDRAVVRTPGRCGYRFTLSATALPPAPGTTIDALLATLTPGGATVGHRASAAGSAAGRAQWRTWREAGSTLLGGAWAAGRADGGFLVLSAQGVVARRCPAGPQSPLFAVLAGARPSP
ncbi:MAG: hypothetical protein QOE11_2431 [Solirubrobacteraceae bacterium]|nr:hypothetical protein [Solirubrobacteraceae bacterium]